LNERIQFIEQDGRHIILLDVSNMPPGDEFKQFIEDAKHLIHMQQKNSMLTLFDATHSYFDKETIDILKDFAASNRPYVRASAVVGITGLKKMMLDIVSKFSGRTFKQCSTREEAVEWLVKQ